MLFVLLGLFGVNVPMSGATYQVGQVVQDFTLHARYSFTNQLGEVRAPGDPVRLSDFEGKIVFMEFFYVW